MKQRCGSLCISINLSTIVCSVKVYYIFITNKSKFAVFYPQYYFCFLFCSIESLSYGPSANFYDKFSCQSPRFYRRLVHVLELLLRHNVLSRSFNLSAPTPVAYSTCLMMRKKDKLLCPVSVSSWPFFILFGRKSVKEKQFLVYHLFHHFI